MTLAENQATIGNAFAMTTDGTTLWFADSRTIRAMHINSTAITTVAGSQDWSTQGCAATVNANGWAAIQPLWNLTYHFPSKSRYALTGNSLVRIA